MPDALDGAAWHRAVALRVPSRLRLLPLPPYSPELNPVEHIWEHLRENYFGNRVFPSLGAVVDQLCAGLRDLDQHPEIVKAMTNFDWINTLRMMSNYYENVVPENENPRNPVPESQITGVLPPG